MSGLAVDTLRLGQFRSYDAGLLAPEGASVALYGPNGAGKTNVLEAVSLLVPGRGLRRAGGEELARKPGDHGWRVRAELTTHKGAIEVVTGAQGGPRTVEIDGKAATQTALGHLVRVVWLTPVMDRLWLEGASDRRRFLDRLTLGFSPDHGEAALTYEKAMRERNRLLKDGVFDAAWLGGLEAQMARAGARIA
ncbi:MAG: DNA replication and repair protein RecF, partial [Pseudomonadota bacterium]